MRAFLRLPSVQLSLWTLFVWGVRLRNADGAVWATALSLLFLGLAVAALTPRRNRPVVTALAGLTVLVWSIRILDIALLSDHGAAFTVVHIALGAVSVLLAARAIRDARQTAGRSGQPALVE